MFRRFSAKFGGWAWGKSYHDFAKKTEVSASDDEEKPSSKIQPFQANS
jgi:hypothetical protein